MGKRIVIVSPAVAGDNNGNWQTASRWSAFLQAHHDVSIASAWAPGDAVPDLLVALHARRSAPSLAAFAACHPDRPSILVLTGTDLYRDIHASLEAAASLRLASALVVLQEDGLRALPPALRPRTRVIHQSAPPRAAPGSAPRARHGGRTVDICMIGHLRAEKDPLTFMRAARLVGLDGVRLLHIGGVLDPALGAAATAAMEDTPRYRWLGALPHDAALDYLERSHAMVIASVMEGGANVIIEAISAGVPVLASGIGGNRGMLGEDYAGYFPLGDAAALARLVERSVADTAFHVLLRAQCAARAPLFAPAAEAAAVRDLVDNLLASAPHD